MTVLQPLLIREHAFSQEVGMVEVSAGQSLQAMLDQAACGQPLADDLVVRIGGYDVPQAMWARVRPKPGTHILCYREAPLQGGSARQILGAVLMVALTVFTAGVASGAYLAGVSVFGLSGAALAAGIGIVGSLAISALTRPPRPGAGATTEGAWRQLTGTSNQVNPWGVIPFVIGESRFYPPHAALPYSETVGEKSYHYYLFDLGHGNLDVSDIRIGNTAIGDFEEVSYQISNAPTLYLNDISEEVVGVTLEHGDSTAVNRTTAPNVTGISVDIVYPQGLFGVGTSGKSFAMWTAWRVRYRPVGTSTWLDPPTPRRSGFQSPPGGAPSGTNQYVAGTRKTPFGCSIAWDVPVGQYQVQVQRLGSLRGGSANTYVDSATWSVLRSIKHGLPSTTGTVKLALRIRASDQLTGTLQTLSCLVKQKIKVYDPDTETWSSPVTSTNPAWVAWWLMTACPGVARKVPETRMDLQSFVDFAEFCDTHSFEVRGVCDSAQVLRELVDDVLACSLGSLGQRDGRYGVVFDPGEAEPSMVFTPAETKDFKFSRVFTRIPHALRVQFINPDADWQQDEIIVLDDGYSYRGVDARGNASSAPAPTEFETLQLRYAADAIHAWQVGRYHLAQAKFRSTTYSWDSDIAGLGTVRGDCVEVPNDVTEWLDGWGQVVLISDGGIAGATATVVLDQYLDTDPAKSYRMQFRTASGWVAADLVASGGSTNEFALVTKPDGVAKGDVAILGESAREPVRLLVTGVRYTQDLGTSFTAVAYDDRVAPYWADPPESIVSEITGLPLGVPDPPEVIGVIAQPENDDADDAGIVGPQARIGIRPPSRVLERRALQ